MSGRDSYGQRTVLACAGLSVAFGYAFWGLAVGPRRLRIERHVVRLPGLPPSWSGSHVALLADIQVGMPLGNRGVAAKAIRDILRRRPAAVLLAGDFVLHPAGESAPRISAVARLLAPLAEAGVPAFAVLGNHDHQQPSDVPRDPPLEERVAAALRQAGIRVLRNEAVELPAPRPTAGTQPLYLVGLGAHRPGDDDVRAAFSELPAAAPRIVMMHNPDTFPCLPAGSAPFAVAGHTHGAQVRLLPGDAPPWWMRLAGMPEDLRRGAGWLRPGFGCPGNRLYVSRGIGFSRAPLRINAPPELTYFQLEAAEPREAGRAWATG